MTKKEFERRARLTATLTALGFTEAEADALRRISNTLRRWHELECGDGNEWGSWAIETGARKRLAAIIEARNGRPQLPMTPEHAKYDGNLAAYIQTDPRGAALYILRPGDVPEGGSAGAYYDRGICVY